MIGLVIVSHSARLAEGVCELAAQVGQGRVRLAAAGGTSDPEHPIGTDPFKVLEAVESLAGGDGVLVFMDLGSAVLSAETALEMLPEERRAGVRLCPGPVVEGAVAAASLAAAGASLDEIAAAVARLGRESEAPRPPAEGFERRVRLRNRLGLHARPAARLVRLARRFDAHVTLENVTRSRGPARASSINDLLALGARNGDELAVRASGRDAAAALEAVAQFLAEGCAEHEQPAAATAPAPREGQLQGTPASPGIAIGPLVRWRPAPARRGERRAGSPEAEQRRLTKALEEARQETRALYEWALAHAGEAEAGIFDAQLLFLEDENLLREASRLVLEGRRPAEAAFETAARQLATRLAALDDEYLRSRAADVADAAARLLRRLAGAEAPVALDRPAIVAAPDVAPSQIRDLDPARLLGLCLQAGAPGAHSLILARSMGIPAVVGLGPPLAQIPEGTTVALDGETGAVWIAPDAGQVRQLEQRRKRWLAARAAAAQERLRPAVTRDGRRILVMANIGSVEAAAEAASCGAEGVGVLRTEFLFLGRSGPPPEEEQEAAYRAIATALAGRPLVIRTLDAGGDKALTYAGSDPEANPFLGLRGLRLTLMRRDLLRTQLRAILRVAADCPVAILLPMVSSIEEVREVKRELAALARGAALPKIGVMIEVPAAAAMARELAREASFFSIGTNDLAQYVMAADRTNSRVAALADPLEPAVLRLVGETVRAAREAEIEVTLCGELAADASAAALLIGLGIGEFSVNPPAIAGVKRAIRAASAAEGERLARQALALDSAAAVRRLLAGGG
jgi:phosphocarrier protein FPr